MQIRFRSPAPFVVSSMSSCSRVLHEANLVSQFLFVFWSLVHWSFRAQAHRKRIWPRGGVIKDAIMINASLSIVNKFRLPSNTLVHHQYALPFGETELSDSHSLDLCG
jgi:hypothetical protein